MKSVLYASAALALAASPALANPIQVNHSGSPSQSQVYGDGSSANSNLNNVTGGSSRSYSRGGNATASGGHGGKGGNASSTQNVNINGGYGGGGGYEAPAPDVVLPNIAGGMNSCLGGIGFGGAGKPGGGLFSYTWEMHDCRMRGTGQMLWNAGYRAEALRVWCQIPEVRQAFRGTPQQCPQDGAVQQASTGRREVYPFDYCATRNPGDRNQHLECDRGVDIRHEVR